MKNLILVLICLISTHAFTQTINDGLVGYWPFNNNINDESGNDNHPTYNSGAILTTDRFNVSFGEWEKIPRL